MDRWVLGLLWLIPLQASATVLGHDGWEDGAAVAFATDHCPGDCSAVLFQPDIYPFTVNYVYTVLGPDLEDVTVAVRVMDAGTSLYPDADAVLGGAEDVVLESTGGSSWIEVDLTEVGTAATITAGRFAVAICYLESDDPCGEFGVGMDSGPGVVPDGGVAYIDPSQGCNSGICTGASGSHAWANVAADGNWLLRASDEPWDPTAPTDDDDSAGDDDTADDDTSLPGDDTTDDDTAGTPGEVALEGIEPNAIKEGDFSEFVISGSGFGEDSEVYFGQLRVLPVDVTGDTSILGAFPDGLGEGSYDVCVANPGVSSDCMLDALQVLPASGCGGCSTESGPSGAAAVGAALGVTLALLRRRSRR